uniref:PDZ domain-containing protein n=1 Tax=Glossina brevipalpis TaxID=37001 RepID=A0A1A9WG59_9MUSC
MLFDIKLCRFDNAPWGFRLVGGSDFEFPLTVIKVTEGSLAEEAGLRAGDVIVRINDTATLPLTHEETDKLIRSCGNVDDEMEQILESETKISASCEYLSQSETKTLFEIPDVIATVHHESDIEYLSEQDDRPCSVLSEDTERKMVEEEIAAVLSGETQMLKEHNVMGLFPKPGVCLASDVLRTLNEEATKTKAEKDKENRKWTTFLQKPNRPIPKSKEQIEAERRAANAYKVTIVKSAPRSRSVTPQPPAREVEETQPPPSSLSTKEVQSKPEAQSEREPEPEPEPQPESEIPTPIDSEVPNLEEILTNLENASEENQAEEIEDIEKSDKEKEFTTETEDTADEQEKVENTDDGLKVRPMETEEIEAEVFLESVTKKSEQELELERQLADVQKQLAALSNLPSTIQVTLDAVSRQLADLLPAIRLQQEAQQLQQKVSHLYSEQNEIRSISLEKIDETNKEQNEITKSSQDREHETNKDIKQNVNVAENESVAKNEQEQEQQARQGDNNATEQIANSDTNEVRDTIDNNSIKQRETKLSHGDENHQLDEEQKLKKQKKHDVIEELEEHLDRKNNPKRSKRAFGPLTPSSERPLVLPGGRRWYRPKDAYNDEFIAETLSAQAELITGTTLGVNFMKYQKPERKIDLNRSEVYKVIHHLDRQPVRGIEVRPPVVPAEADVRKAVHS